jgi:hypothetical protein
LILNQGYRGAGKKFEISNI